MLRNELVRRGNTLFRWRSFLPLVLVPPALWMGWEAPDWAHAQVWQVGCWGVGLLGLLFMIGLKILDFSFASGCWGSSS